MKRKKLTALFSALAMLAATAPVFAVDENIPLLIKPEAVEFCEFDEPVLAGELDVLADEAVAVEAAAAADAVDTAETADSTVVAQIVGGESYTSLAEAVSEAAPDATIQLLANIEINSSITIDKKLTLDLNNCTLTSNTANKAISIADGGDLTIVDNSIDPTGKILETLSAAPLSYAVYVEAGGNLTLESGTIEYSNMRGYAVGCAAGASMTIDGGTVKGGYGGISAAGTLKINSGSVSGVNYGIVASNNSTVTMSGGTVEAAYGIYNSGTVKISAGTVTGTCGIYNVAVSSAAEITGGTVTGKSYGIYNKGTLTMSDGEVSSDQYGFYNYTNAAITLKGGTVKAATSNVSKYICAIVSYGSLEINGGTVETIAEGSPNTQGIRSVYNAGTLKMEKGTIRGVFNSTNDEILDYPQSVQGIAGAKGSTTEINGGTVEGISNEPTAMAPFGINCYGNLTINDGTVRAEKGTAITGRGTGDFDGTRYIINGGTITGELGIYHPQDGYMEINGGIITGSLTGIEIRAGEMVVNGGTIRGDGDYFDKAPNGTGSTTIGAGIAVVQHDTKKKTKLTVNAGTIYGYVPLFEGNVHGNPDAAIELVEISLTGGEYTNTNFDDPDRVSVITEDVQHYMTGGMYSSEISYDYIDPEYYRRNWYNGNFEVTKPKFTVIDTAHTIDAEIELPDLIQNNGIDGEPFSTYRVVLSRASDENVQAINKAKAEMDDNNTEMSAFNILVEKTNDRGIKTNITSGILKQKVRVTLINAATPLENIMVYYIDKDDHLAKVEGKIEKDGNTVTFTAPVLSTYAITYNPAPITADNISDKIGVVFSPVAAGGNQYNIILKPLAENKKLHRYMSADIAFKKTCSDGRVIYEIEPAEYMNATLLSENGDSREYHFEMDGINVPDASCVYGEGITIGTITFSGYGTVDLRVDTNYAEAAAIEHTVNIANTAKIADNIVNHYTEKGGALVVNETVDGYRGSPALEEDEKGTIQATFSPDKANLTVNIAFNNAVDNQVFEYQDMTITISGGDLTADKVIELGAEPKKYNTEATVGFDKAYKIEYDDLTRNVAYQVKVEGAGYRTAHYLVFMNGDKTLNFWNNVKDNAEVIEVGAETGKVTNNFLAGDIVKDDEINIFDLSAVVSYFGTDNLVSDHQGYAKYDLNRDGVIDSKDVAYVLVSWGN
ncbi:MAG: hypothetical protein J6N52_04385 [Clostridia bacterium]|nr:hypothetical protein [Clostridia bacterium]